MNAGKVNLLDELLPHGAVRLGLGTSGLTSRLTRRESERVLATAFDGGIRYFDTARMYGEGEAERVLGQHLAGRRSKFVIASKAGILPAKRSAVRGAIYRAAKTIYQHLPLARGAVAARARHFIPPPTPGPATFGVFTVPEIRRSLETSLRELKTDYLDVFLLHECQVSDIRSDDLLSFLDTAKAEGKIRHFGTATAFGTTLDIARAYPRYTSIAQFASNVWEPNACTLRDEAINLTITHSALGGRFHELMARLSVDENLRHQWSCLAGVDAGDRNALGRLFLAYAVNENPDGLVLFGSSRPEHIKANIRSLTDGSTRRAQLDGLARAAAMIEAAT
jgi:aryl-alcohol dehydrogenase-like predicted oxidoreductase